LVMVLCFLLFAVRATRHSTVPIPTNRCESITEYTAGSTWFWKCWHDIGARRLIKLQPFQCSIYCYSTNTEVRKKCTTAGRILEGES
jgi:hypothetical protein